MIQLEHYPIEAIHWAGMNDNCLPDLKKILAKYPDYIQAINNQKDNLIIIATRTGNFEILKYLIEQNKLDLNHEVKEGNAFNIATQYNRNNISLYLLEKGINLFAINDEGQHALFNVSRHGNDDLFELLIQKGLDPNKLDNNNENILFPYIDNYISHRNYYCFELIIEQLSNACLFHKNSNGLNILEYMDFLIEDSGINLLRKEKLIECFSPLFAILKSRQFESTLE